MSRVYSVLILLVVLASFCLGIKFLASASHSKENTYEYYEMLFRADPLSYECVNDSLGIFVRVHFREIEGEVVGQWWDLSSTIMLEEFTPDTISHEVYHAIRFFGKQIDLYDDEEYLAYMTGSLNSCVNELVVRHLNEK